MKNSENSAREEILASIRSYQQRFYSSHVVPGGETLQPAGKLLAGNEFEYMVDAVLDGWLTAGRYNEQFETRFAEFTGAKHCLTVNSGSSANLVAFSSLTSPLLKSKALRPADEIITVAAGFPTTVNPIIQNLAIPVFVDIDRKTLNIDVAKIRNAITEKTKGVMLAHTLGNPFNVEAVRSICKEYDLWLVEDCCDALGAKFDGLHVGTTGDIATCSFYPAHHLTMGEGGAVFTQSGRLRKIAESFRDWGRDCFCPPGRDNTCKKRFDWDFPNLPAGYDHKYVYSHVGFNLKITDMQAACGLAQLEQLDGFVARRRENFDYLRSILDRKVPNFDIVMATEGADPSWFGFAITITKDGTQSRSKILQYLNEKKIGTRLLFAGNITKQPYMSGVPMRAADDLANTNKVMNDTFWVGIHPALDASHLDYIAQNLITANNL